jgi:excisionase family DNA binding protein
MDKEFYSTKELAAVLGVQPLTLFRHVQAGKLVAYRVGKNYRFRRQDVEDWLTRQRVLPKAAPDKPKRGRRNAKEHDGKGD